MTLKTAFPPHKAPCLMTERQIPSAPTILPSQVRLIAITSIVTGLFFGLTFGVMDLEDELVTVP